ncbi:unnamed protein product, partial [Coregonus sp. 'balchen']
MFHMYRLYKEKNPMAKAKFWLYRISHLANKAPTIALKCYRFYKKLSSVATGEDKGFGGEKAEKAYSQLQKDTEWAKANSDCHVRCVDLQGVMYTPSLSHTNIYYQRQLSNYNLSVQDLGTEEPETMCIWHEGVAHRGSLEVASCVLKWVQTKFTPLVKPRESDRCCGQNNNW